MVIAFAFFKRVFLRSLPMNQAHGLIIAEVYLLVGPVSGGNRILESGGAGGIGMSPLGLQALVVASPAPRNKATATSPLPSAGFGLLRSRLSEQTLDCPIRAVRGRSEERRVGKECRSRWEPDQ